MHTFFLLTRVLDAGPMSGSRGKDPEHAGSALGLVVAQVASEALRPGEAVSVLSRIKEVANLEQTVQKDCESAEGVCVTFSFHRPGSGPLCR